MQVRCNAQIEEAVRKGLIINAAKGSANAWAYMASSNVPQSVILRVLSNPAGCRRDDQIAVEIGQRPIGLRPAAAP